MATFNGTSGNDTLTGTLGEDIFHMESGGNDVVMGSGRNDRFYFGASFTGEDVIDGGGGRDEMDVSGEYSSPITIARGQITSIEDLIFDARFSYTVTLENGFNGNRSDVVFFVGYGGNFVGASLAFDASAVLRVPLSISGNNGADTLIAGGGVDFLSGYVGNDFLSGGKGEDYILGGSGADRLSGGDGDDRFAYDIGDLGTPRVFDIITDFTTGDQIDLSQINTDFHVGRTAGRSGDIVARYARDTDETTVRMFTDEDNKADLVIHLTGRHVDLTPADFIFHG